MSNSIHQIVVEGKFGKFLKEANEALRSVQKLGGGFERLGGTVGVVNNLRSAIRGVTEENGKATQSAVRLQKAIIKDFQKQQAIASGSLKVDPQQLGFMVSDRASVYKNFGLDEASINGILSGYYEAQERAIRNADNAFREQVEARRKQLISRSNNISKEFRLDGTLASDSRDVYAELVKEWEASGRQFDNVYAAMFEVRSRTIEAIRKEIAKIKNDALAMGRAVKQSDIDKVSSRIQSQSEVVGVEWVAQLKQELATAQRSVADTLRTRSVESLRKTVESEVKSAELSVKQLQQQLNRFREGSKAILTETRSSMGRDEFQQVLGNLIPQMKAEKEALHKAFRQPILNTLQSVTKQTTIDIEQLRSLRSMFSTVGGDNAAFTGNSVAGILDNLKAKVSELTKSGDEFPRELVAFYAKLFRAAGESGSGLATLVSYLKQQAAAVNTNAEAMRVEQVRAQISKVIQEYNQAGQVLSKAILDKLQRDWSAVSKTVFDDAFKQLMREQNRLSDIAKTVQISEGIWKPFRGQLDSLGKLSNIDFKAYDEQLNLALRERLESRLKAASRALWEQAKAGGIDKGVAAAEIRKMFDDVDKISVDIETKVYNDLNARFKNIRQQLTSMRKGGDRSALPNVTREYQAILKEVDAFQDQEMKSRARRLTKYRDAVMASFAKDDTLKRAEQMIRSGARSLGGSAALKIQLREIRSAYEEMARSVEQYDKALADRLRRQSRELRQQALAQYQNRSIGGRAGRGGAGDALGAYGLSEGVLRNYRRQLPMQITDIVVGLSTGQLPMYVLLQQGGQLRDMFGGIGNAVKEVSKYLLGWTDNMTKFQMATAAAKRVLAGIAVGAIAGMALLMKKAADFNAQIRNTTVELRFRGSDVSGDEFRDYSERMSRSLGIARTNAAAIFKQIAIDAKLPKESFYSLIEGLDDISTALGNGWDTKGLQETVTLLGQSFKDKDSFKQLAADYALFTDEQYKAILQLYDQKDAAGAASLAMETLKKNTLGAKDEAMTPFQKAVDEAKKELLNCLQVVGDGSAWQALLNNLTEAAKGFINLIGPIAKAASAVMSFIKIIGNTAVGAVFKGEALFQGVTVSGQEAKIERLTGQLKALKEAESISGANTLRSARMNEIQQQIKEAESIIDIAKARQEAAEITASFSKLDASDAIDELTGLKQAAQDAIAPTAKLTATTASLTGVLKRQPNGDDKPTKRGGSRSGAQTDKDLENAQRYVQQLKEQVDEVSKMTNLQKLQYEIDNGKLVIGGALLDQAREYAKTLDERAAKERKIQRIQELQNYALEKQQQLQDKLIEYTFAVRRMTEADSNVALDEEYLRNIVAMHREERRLNREFRRRQESDDYKRLGEAEKQQLQKDLQDKIKLNEDYYNKLNEVAREQHRIMTELGTSWTSGFDKGLEETAFKVRDLSSEVSSAVQSWMDQLGDKLATFVRTGKFSFRDLADSILSDFARLAANDFIRNLVGGFRYGFGKEIASSGTSDSNSLITKALQILNSERVQHVWVDNPGFDGIGSAITSIGKGAEFTLGSQTSLFGKNNQPMFDFSSATQIGYQVAKESAKTIEPVVKAGADSMFGGLTNSLSSLFKNVFSGIGNVFSSFGGGGGNNFFGSLFSGIGSFISGIFGGGWAAGGYTGPGGKYTPAGIVHAGEYVINAASTRRLGLDFLNKLNGYADGGYVSAKPSIVSSSFSKDVAPMEVNIYNNGDNQVRTRRNSSGGLDVFIEQVVNAVAGDISSGGNVAAALQQTYALNRGVGIQRTGY